MGKYKTLLPANYAPKIVTNIRTGQKKAAAYLVEKEEYTLEMLAAEIANSTTATATDVMAVVAAFVDFSMRHLAEGHRVSLGALGKLFPTLKTTPTQYLEDVDKSIKAMKARFTPSEQLVALLSQATFTMVAPKSGQDEALETKKEAIYKELGHKPKPEDGEGDEGDGN